MSNNFFNKNRYFELLQKEKTLKNSDLWESESSESLELMSYRIILEDQITYNNREKYISLLEEHIKEPFYNDLEDIDLYLESYSAIVELSELFDQDLEDFYLLENKILKEGITILDNFSIDSISNSSEFSSSIAFIVQFDVDEEISEEDYGIIMEGTLSELRNCVNRASRICNDNEVLRSTMIFFTVVTFLAYSVLNPTIFNLLQQSVNI